MVLVGAEEGIYTLNLNYIHDSTMDLLYPRRCAWLHVTKGQRERKSGRKSLGQGYPCSALIFTEVPEIENVR